MSLRIRLTKLEAQIIKTGQDVNHASHENTKQWLNDILKQMRDNNRDRLQKEPYDL